MTTQNFGTLKNNELLVSNHPLTIRANAPESEFRSRIKQNIDILWQRQGLIIQDLQGITIPDQLGSNALDTTIDIGNGNAVSPPFVLNCASSVSIGNIDICSFIQMDDNVALRLGTGTGLNHDATLSYNGIDVILNPKAEGSGKFNVSGNIFSDNFDTTSIANNILIGTTVGAGISGTRSIGIGTSALGSLGPGYTGSDNFAAGHNSMGNITIATLNVGIGTFALRDLTTGSGNVCLGVTAGASLTTQIQNFALGWESQRDAIGNKNVSIGSQSLRSVSGSDNVGIGDTAGFALTSGRRNVVIGSLTFNSATTGQQTTAIGFNALTASDSDLTVAIGAFAGSSLSGNSDLNTLIGYAAGLGSGIRTNMTIIGGWAGHWNATSNRFIVDSRLRANAAQEFTNAILHGDMANSVSDQVLRINAEVIIAAQSADVLTLGTGTAGVDYIFKIDGENNDGVLTWKQNQDYFEFSDDTFHALGERAFFASTSNFIDSRSGNGSSGIVVRGDFAIYLNNNEILFGDQTAADILLRFDTSTNDGLITWSRTNDYFQFADDVLLDETLTITGETSANDDILLASGKTIGQTNAGGLGFDASNNGSFSSDLEVNGHLDVGLNNPSSVASTGTINLRIGMLRATPTNVTDAYVAVQDTGGPGNTAGDLILIARSSVTAGIRMFTGSTTPLERLTILDTGEVGIGISNPEATLHIEDADTGLSPNSDGNLLCIEGATGVGATMGMSFLSSITSEVFILYGDSGDNKAGWFSFNHSGDLFAWGLGANEKMRLNGNGALMINGTSSTGSEDKLQIFSSSNVAVNSIISTFSTTTTVNSKIIFRKSNNITPETITQTTTGHVFGDLDFEGVDSGNGYAIGGRIRVVQNGAAGASVLPGDMILSTWDGTSENSNQLVLLNDGNVGIGTATPGDKLDVAGNIKLTGSDLFLKTDGEYIRRDGFSNTNFDARKGFTFNLDTDNNDSSSVFTVTRDGSIITDFVINEGDVGIGDATPSFKLDINGTLRAVGAVNFDSTLLVAGNVTIGDGSAVDITLTFDTSTNDGLITWSRTNDYFEFSDDTFHAEGENAYFGTTANKITNVLANGASGISITGENAIYLLSNQIRFGDLTAADITLNFDTSTNDGLITWSRTNDYFDVADTLKTSAGRIINRTNVTSSPYTVLATNEHLSVTTASVAITIDLPAISSTRDGTIFHIKDQDGTAATNNITVDANGSDTIENAATAVIANNGGSITIVANNDTSNWEIQ